MSDAPNIIVATDRSPELKAEKADFDRRTTKPEMLTPRDAALMTPKVFDLIEHIGVVGGHERFRLTCDKCGAKREFDWFTRADVMLTWKTCCQDNALLFCREVGRWRNRIVNPTPGVKSSTQ